MKRGLSVSRVHDHDWPICHLSKKPWIAYEVRRYVRRYVRRQIRIHVVQIHIPLISHKSSAVHINGRSVGYKTRIVQLSGAQQWIELALKHLVATRLASPSPQIIRIIGARCDELVAVLGQPGLSIVLSDALHGRQSIAEAT